MKSTLPYQRRDWDEAAIAMWSERAGMHQSEGLARDAAERRAEADVRAWVASGGDAEMVRRLGESASRCRPTRKEKGDPGFPESPVFSTAPQA